jgi:hypothetical protein
MHEPSFNARNVTFLPTLTVRTHPFTIISLPTSPRASISLTLSLFSMQHFSIDTGIEDSLLAFKESHHISSIPNKETSAQSLFDVSR